MARALEEVIADGPKSATARTRSVARRAAPIRRSSSKAGPVTSDAATVRAMPPSRTSKPSQAARRVEARAGDGGGSPTGARGYPVDPKRATDSTDAGSRGRRLHIAKNFRRGAAPARAGRVLRRSLIGLPLAGAAACAD